MTLISNNCAGGAILHSLGMEFTTPTILLQILPEQFPKFCLHAREYLSEELIELKPENMTQKQIDRLNKMFGCVPNMPYGLLGDVVICFQHYPTFAEAKQKWNERNARVDFENMFFLMHARGPEYQKEAEAFLQCPMEHKLCLTQGFEVPGSVRFDGEGFEDVGGQLRITTVYDFGGWLNGSN